MMNLMEMTNIETVNGNTIELVDTAPITFNESVQLQEALFAEKERFSGDVWFQACGIIQDSWFNGEPRNILANKLIDLLA